MTQAAQNAHVVTGETKQARQRSNIEFPYTSLDDAVDVAKAILKVGGNEARIEVLAAEMGHSTSESGGFKEKVRGARLFGLTSAAQGIVSLTPLGARIVDPNTENSARVEAFLTVPLYKSIADEFRTGFLPPNEGLENKMVSLGVAQKQKDRARQTFQRSAKEAGFFAYGTNRLVYPASGKPSSGNSAKVDKPIEPPKGSSGNGGDGGGGEQPDFHPLIAGLIGALPKSGAWSLEQRRKWLQAAAMNFDFVYESTDADQGTIKVTVEGVSAR